MEKLLHYTWRHKLLPLGTLRTTDGQEIEIISTGLYNRNDAGPDFINAKLKIDGTEWAGNVEIHIKASDWYRHRHDTDSAYDNVILHVVEQHDMEVGTSQNRRLPTLILPIPNTLKHDYEELLQSEKYPPCYKTIPTISPIKRHAWLSALQTERLEQKTATMEERVKSMNGSWEDAYFATLAHNFGFGINGNAFDTWAQSMPMKAVAHHRDNLFQVEALFIGQAGLLEKVEERYKKEYEYLRHKFGLTPIRGSLWRYLRTRPQNFPHVRLLQLAAMYHERRTGLSELLACTDIKAIGKLYGITGKKLELLVINTAIPAIFAYGRSHAKEQLCERAGDMLEQMKAEDNNIVRMWAECGLQTNNAGDSQALIQLKKNYCDKKDCLRCRFGHAFLSGEHRQAFLYEQ